MMAQEQPETRRRARGDLLTHLWDPRTARVLCTILLFALVLYFLRAARDTLTLFLFAVWFAYLLAPLVRRLQRPLRGRGKAIFAVYVALGVVLTVLGFLIGPHVAVDARSLLASVPELVNKFASGQLIQQFGERHHWSVARDQQLQRFVAAHRSAVLNYVGGLIASLAGPAKHIWWLLLIPILGVFLLKQGQQITDSAAALARSPEQRETTESFLSDVDEMIGGYIQAQVILAGTTTAAYLTFLGLMHMPYAFVLAPISGLLEFIPVVGPAISAAAIVLIGLLVGFNHVLWLIFFLGCWRLQQDYFSAPRIMGKTVEINPLMQIFAVLAGGEIAGVVGALVSVPVVAILRILWHLLAPRGARRPARQD